MEMLNVISSCSFIASMHRVAAQHLKLRSPALHAPGVLTAHSFGSILSNQLIPLDMDLKYYFM